MLYCVEVLCVCLFQNTVACTLFTCPIPLFSLLSTSFPLILFFLSLSLWNGHLRLFALSGMSGTQLSSHGEEGGGWGKSAVPNLLPKAPENPEWGKRKMCLRKEDCVGHSEKTGKWLLTGRKKKQKQHFVLLCEMNRHTTLTVECLSLKKRGNNALKWPEIKKALFLYTDHLS